MNKPGLIPNTHTHTHTHTPGLRVLSLFDGISCGYLALKRIGLSVGSYDAYEIDPNAIKISQSNFPEIHQHGDVLKADFKQYYHYDLLLGGSPCQSLSIIQSKARENLNGKSKLFFEFVRAKEEAHPKFFLFENVASMNAESRDLISKLLDCEPILLDSKYFSAQQRPRYYWTNIPLLSIPSNPSSLVLRDIMEPEPVAEKYYYKAPLADLDLNKQVCATLQVNTHQMLKRVFNPNFKVHALTCVSGGYQHKKVLVGDRCRRLTPLEYERLQTLPDYYTASVQEAKRYSAVGNAWTVDVIAFLLHGLEAK